MINDDKFWGGKRAGDGDERWDMVGRLLLATRWEMGDAKFRRVGACDCARDIEKGVDERGGIVSNGDN